MVGDPLTDAGGVSRETSTKVGAIGTCQMQIRLEELPDVISPTSLAAYFQVDRTTLWRWEKTNPHFPKAKRFSARKTGYLRSEVEKYLNSL